MESFGKMIGAALGIVIVGIVVVCLAVARSMVPSMAFTFVGGLTTFFHALFIVLIILLGLSVIGVVAAGVTYFLQRHYQDIGQFGTISITRWGRQEQIAPLAIAAPRERTKVQLVVPTVAELLKENMLGTDSLLLGFDMEGKPYYGSWADVRTFAIAGKGRSGKTITMFFIIIQAILNDAIVWVADPHAAKKSSITQLLQPLAHWIRFAKTDTEIAEMTGDFIDMMEARITGESQDLTPAVLVTDEFTRMVDANEQVYEAVVACAQQYAGVNGYAIIAGHEWTMGGKMLPKLRRALHAKFVHRLDEGYAKYLLNNAKVARGAEKLHTGFCYFQDTEGDVHELKTPLGTVGDAETVSRMIAQIAGPEYPKQIVSPGEINVSTQAETNHFTEVLSLKSSKIDEVKRLRMLHFNQSRIIWEIWQVKPGESQAYKDALAEYKRIIEQIVRTA